MAKNQSYAKTRKILAVTTFVNAIKCLPRSWQNSNHNGTQLFIQWRYWPFAFLAILNFYFRAILTELRHVSKDPKGQNLKSAVGIPLHSHSTNQEMKTSAATDRLLSQWVNVIKTVISMWDRKNCIFVSYFNKLIFYTLATFRNWTLNLKQKEASFHQFNRIVMYL